MRWGESWVHGAARLRLRARSAPAVGARAGRALRVMLGERTCFIVYSHTVTFRRASSDLGHVSLDVPRSQRENLRLQGLGRALPGARCPSTVPWLWELCFPPSSASHPALLPCFFLLFPPSRGSFFRQPQCFALQSDYLVWFW